ncbi:MYCBP-associated protein, partial [Galemys pyrenaicus]
ELRRQARGRGLMKKLSSKLSPPKLLGGCAPPRRALVAMDAVAAAGGQARARGRGGEGGGGGRVARPSYPGSPRRRPRSQPQPQPGRHDEVPKEGIPLQTTSKQILGGRRKLERLALAALGAQETSTGTRVFGWESRYRAWRMGVTPRMEVGKRQEKKRAKVPEQPTPPIQEEIEPVSNVLQGDDILALAIKSEDLKKQHIPRLKEDKPIITQKFIIRKFKPKDSRRTVCHLVAHPATPDAATKPLDYSGPADTFHGTDQILPHHILGSLQDFKRIAVARGNTQLAELIHTPPSLMTLISAKEEPKQKAPKGEKTHPQALSPQHNFLRNWQHNIALRKRQQEALSEHLKKPVTDLLMHTGDTYRRIQEERELIDRALPTQHDGKARTVLPSAWCGGVCNETTGFWSRLECLGDEMTGLVMTKTKTQRGLREPITHIRKPSSIREETGLQAKSGAWYRYTWDRSLFLIHRRKELQSIMAELDFSQKVGSAPISQSEAPCNGTGLQSANHAFLGLSEDIDGLEVVGRGQPFSTVTVEDYSVSERNQENSSEDSLCLDIMANYPDVVPMPILGPSLLFCGKPACWIRGSNPQDKKQVGIAVRLTFETLEGEKTSSELTVVNNGTVAIWYDWRRQAQLDSFQDMKRNRMQRFYFDNRGGVILPGETKTFTFFFKSLDVGIFRESWEFGTHPTLLGGAVLQVNLHAVSLSQDMFRDERMSLKKKLAAHEAVTVVKSMLQELLRGILTPERAQSPVDTYLTEEDLFRHRNPQLHYQHQVVRNLHRLWSQYMVLPPKTEEARPGEEEHLGPGTWGANLQSAFLEKSSTNVEPMGHSRSPGLEFQLPRQETEALRTSQNPLVSQKPSLAAKISQRKSIMEEILVEASPDAESIKSSWELDGLPPAQWNLCLGDFRKAVMSLPEENQREDTLIRLNKAALELCQDQRPLQSDFLYQMCLPLWWDVIDSMVSYSLWLRALLGLPEKETVYLDMPDEQDHKSPPVMEVKVTSGRVGKEDRKGTTQEKKLGIRDKEDKKGSKLLGKEACHGDRLNSKKHKAKDDKKPLKSLSRDRLSMEDPAPDSTTPSQEPIDPLVMEKYIHRLHTEVYGLLDSLVSALTVLADELSPITNVEEPLGLCT